MSEENTTGIWEGRERLSKMENGEWGMENGELGTHNRVGSETGSSLIVNSQFPAKGGFGSAKEMADRSGGDEPTPHLPLKPTTSGKPEILSMILKLPQHSGMGT